MNDSEGRKRRFIFVIGKGTLGKLLACDNDLTHISIGDLLRENAASSAAIGWHVKNGALLPTEFLFPLLRETVCDSPAGCPIVLDGFPRRLDQALAFERVFGEPALVLFFQCPREVACQRVVNRAGRPADNSEGFGKRYKEYLELNPDVLDHYGSTRGKDKLVEVNTSGATETSYAMLLAALNKRKEWSDLVYSDNSTPSP
ncbi:hypothetical protein C8A05DRAFT_43445 [Staphylotrichum tortipilum]|uniref:Adenylate kinase n=1 Tax=Staphylotrichum tortipilum TaxID=2831512 RepID=A0AAN6MNN8_9PEZI|nr:hypothetical protein C8A05DRAFT_43445 [Staphylotrichum longicolle]